MAFSQESLRRIADTPSYFRGVRVFNDLLVDEPQTKPLPRGRREVRGVIHDEEKQRAHLILDASPDGIESYHCTCPHLEFGACKHVVALGLAFLEKTAEPAPVGSIKPSSNRHRIHDLHTIEIGLSYDADTDVLRVQMEALYGPVRVKLGAPSKFDQGIVRDEQAELECLERIKAHTEGLANPEEGALEIYGVSIYLFAQETLTDLQLLYTVKIDPSAARILDIEEAPITSTWNTRASGIDLFEFSVDWQCGQTQLPIEKLRSLVQSGQSFFRDEDGRFVTLSNPEEVKQLLEFVDETAEKGKGFRTNFFRLPEMQHLLQRSATARLSSMDTHVQTFLDDAKTGKTMKPVELPAQVKKILRPYQIQGVEWGMFLRSYHFGGILADDMGLGKTLQALTLVAHSRTPDSPPSLVVCPKTLVSVWLQEAQKFFPELKVMTVEGSPKERKRQLDQIKQHELVIMSYPVLMREIQPLLKMQQTFEYCIADEAQYMKNAASNTAAIMKLVPASYRLALTGTPIENGVHELWSIFDFLMPGFLGDRQSFRIRFERPIQEKQDQQALDLLLAKIKPFVLRRTKESHLKELPAKIEQIRQSTLTPEQLVIYTQTLAKVRQDIFQTVRIKGFKRSRIEILSALMRLRRVCDHPALVDPTLSHGPELSGKMQQTLELVHEAVDGGHKVLLFSQFTTMLDLLREALDKSGIGHCTIEGKTQKRDEQVKRFFEDPTASVFLLSLKAGGTGLTLTQADTVILYDPWWNPMAERQAMDRAHRIGQTKTVNVYKLITQGTIEERVLALQERKKKIFDALMTENAEALKALTWEEIKELFE